MIRWTLVNIIATINYKENEYVTNSNDTGITSVADASENYYSAVRTKSPIEPECLFDKKPVLNAVPKSLEMDFTRILNKPYFIKNIIWPTTVVKNTILSTLSIPLDIFVNALAKVPFAASALYRTKLKLLLQVSGTPMHQGILIVSALPRGTTVGSSSSALTRNVHMNAPHVFLNANESTSVVLEVPFYVGSMLAKTDLDATTPNPNFSGTNYAEVPFVVVSQLAAPASASSNLTISVHAIFTDMEFYVPHTDFVYVPVAPAVFTPQGFISDVSLAATRAIDGAFTTVRRLTGDFLDASRGAIKAYTGLHSPNDPTLARKTPVTMRQMANLTDAPTQFEKMDPFSGFDRVCKDAIFDSSIDEMDMKYILQKPQYIGSFAVKATDNQGALCWGRPITPSQTNITGNYTNSDGISVTSTFIANNLQNFHYLSKYWKGSLKLHIQSSMSNFHFCKLAIARDYSPRNGVTSGFPPFADIQNLLTESIEFSAGGQVQTIELPFASALSQLPCSLDWANNAVQHGMYYIYLMQPLVVNGAVSSSIEFNVYLSAGDDFQYYGYATNPARIQYSNYIMTIPTSDPDAVEGDEDFDPNIFVSQGEVSPESAVVVNPQEELSIKSNSSFLYDALDFRPITNIRDYGRRLYKTFDERYSLPQVTDRKGIFVFDVAKLLGKRPNDTMPITNLNENVSTLQLINKMFLGYAGGARVKLVVTGSSTATAWYVPPSYGIVGDTTGSDTVWYGAYPGVAPGTLTTPASIARFKEMYETIRTSTNTTDTAYSVQTVLQEKPNYVVAGSLAGIYDSGGSAFYMSSGSCVMELEIPNMSPYRFVGDSTSFSAVSGDYLTRSGSSDLGSIVLYVPASAQVGGAELSTNIEVYVGMDDVARMGYQVNCPTITIPATVRSTAGSWDMLVPYAKGDDFTTFGIQSTNPFPSIYFTKTT